MIDSLSQELAAAKNQRAPLQAKNEQLEELRSQFEEILQFRSWRITVRLRKLKERLTS